MIACFPVYRSYIDDRGGSESDRRYIEPGRAPGERPQPAAEPAGVPVHPRSSAGDEPGSLDRGRPGRRRFAGKFQQVTSPVAAKGVEDTAFYVYNRLVSLNEVGGDPAGFGSTAEPVPRIQPDAAGPLAASRFRRFRRTTPSEVRTCVHGSTCFRRFPRNGLRGVERWRRLQRPSSAKPSTTWSPPTPTKNTCSTRR